MAGAPDAGATAGRHTVSGDVDGIACSLPEALPVDGPVVVLTSDRCIKELKQQIRTLRKDAP